MKIDQCSLRIRKCDDLLRGQDVLKLAMLREGNSAAVAEAEEQDEGQNSHHESQNGVITESVKEDDEIRQENGIVGMEPPTGRSKRSAAQLASVRLVAALPDRAKPRNKPHAPLCRTFKSSELFPVNSLKLHTSPSEAKYMGEKQDSSCRRLCDAEALPPNKKPRTNVFPSRESSPSNNVDAVLKFSKSGKISGLGTPGNDLPTKGRRGRPKGSKNKMKYKGRSDDLSGSLKFDCLEAKTAPPLPPGPRIQTWLEEGCQKHSPGVFAVKSKPAPVTTSYQPPPMPAGSGAVAFHYPVLPNVDHRQPMPPFSPHEFQYYDGKRCQFDCACPECLPLILDPGSTKFELVSAENQGVTNDRIEEQFVLNWHRSHKMSNGDASHPSFSSEWMNDHLEKTKLDDWAMILTAPNPEVEASRDFLKSHLLPAPELPVPRQPFFGITRVINPIRVSDGEVECSWCSKIIKRQSFRAHVYTWHKKVGAYRCGMCNKGFARRGDCQIHLKAHEDPLLDDPSTTMSMSSLCEDSMPISSVANPFFDGFPDAMSCNDDASVDAGRFWKHCDDENSSSNNCISDCVRNGTAVASEHADLGAELINASSILSDDVSVVAQAFDSSVDAWEDQSQEPDHPDAVSELLFLEEEGILTPVAMFPVVRQVSSSEIERQETDVKEYLIIDDSSINVFARQFSSAASIDVTDSPTYPQMAVVAAVLT